MRRPAKTLGLMAVFLFSLKGLLWLTVPALLAIRGCE